MGVSTLILPKKESEFKLANYIWLLGMFGIVHGANEWLDMQTIIKGRIAMLDLIRWFCLVVSYAFLFEFGRRLFIGAGKTSGWRKSASRYLQWRLTGHRPRGIRSSV